jgi:hypothetical protein
MIMKAPEKSFLFVLLIMFQSYAMAAQDNESLHAVDFEEDIVGVLIGGAREHRDDGAVLGLEYEHRFTENFGLGAIAEHTFGDFNTWVYALPFAYHQGHWKLYAAPGNERRKGENESMFRLGVEYGIHFEHWEVSPQVDLDFVGDEKVYILGVTFAKGI